MPFRSPEIHDLIAARLPELPEKPDQFGIGVIGAGFIVRDCHLPAYAKAGFRVAGITSRTIEKAAAVAHQHAIPLVASSVEQLLDQPDVQILDIAVPPGDQPEVIRTVLKHPACGHRLKGILAQKPLAMNPSEAVEIVRLCEEAGVLLQVNQNMRYDPAIRVAKALIERGQLGLPVLATINMRAVPHWMPWARNGRSLSTYIMSIHHLDCFRYWLGDPERVMASTRKDRRTEFEHKDGLNLYILEFANDARASAWDDVWAGPVKEGASPQISIDWRVEGTEGLAFGSIGWPGWPNRVPSTLKFSRRSDLGVLYEPSWSEAWFPDAFAGTMAGLIQALEKQSQPDIHGRDNLRTIALCEAVFRSAQTHRVVDLAEIMDEMKV